MSILREFNKFPNINLNFAMNDRKACLPIVETMIDCANTARKYGVLALEEFVQKHDNEFLKVVMMLIVDGTDPELVKNIGTTLILADNHMGKGLLERLIILEGCLSVQAGENPRIIATHLYCMLGESYLRYGRVGVNGDIAAIPIEELYKRLESALNGKSLNEVLDHTLRTMSNCDLQQILREVYIKDLSIALKGFSKETATHIFNNVSQRLAELILSNLEGMGPLQDSDVLKYQEKIENIITRLQNAGEIIIARGAV